MENLIKQLGIFLAVVGVSVYTLMLPRYAYSQYYSQGEGSKSISIDKRIRPISSDRYFDNIDKAVKVFYEKDIVEFSILVENTGNRDLTNLTLNDFLPSFQNILFNPGVYNKKTSQIDWTIGNLAVGESKVFNIRTRIGEVNGLYTRMLTNKVCVNGDSVSDCDRASFFVGGKSVPKTGAEGILLQSLLGVSAAGIALGLRKFARGY